MISAAPDTNVLSYFFGSDINLRTEDQKGEQQGYSSGNGYFAVSSRDADDHSPSRMSDEEANSQRRSDEQDWFLLACHGEPNLKIRN